MASQHLYYIGIGITPELSDFMTKICADILRSRFFENREHTRWSVEDFLKSLSLQEISAERVRKLLNSG